MGLWCFCAAGFSSLLGHTHVNRSHHQELLNQAIAGDKDALGELLEDYRAYLTVLAQRYLDNRLKGRLDAADVVQITFLEAQRDIGAFRGHHIEELLGWLRHILRNNVSSAHQRHLQTQKRSAKREVSNSPTDSRPAFTDVAPAELTTPSQRMMRDEAAVYLANCLEEIPDTQREAIRLRYVEGCSLKEISAKMGKSEMAVAGLLKRGLQALRNRMISDSSAG
ncbi:MAG TPA: RNA polymerase subunit sigma-70 [Planctomycetaceae bacterium]|nr:RNA polymerase subunit sigma-70 [Planctomycetaceae bacterium]